MAYTLAQYQALQDALATGELEVQYEGKTIRYRSVAELRAALGLIKAELIADGTLSAPTASTTFATFSKD